MLIPRWRLALTAGALVILGAIGAGLVQAAVPAPGPAADPVLTAADPDATLLDDIIMAAEPSTGGVPDRAQRLRDRIAARAAGVGGLRKRLVHGTITMLDRDGKLVTVQLDHGTLSAIGSDSITIAEAGGGSVTVRTSDQTRVRIDRALVPLADLKTGVDVIVQSTLDGGAATARRIVVPPVAPAAPAPSAPGG